MVMAVSNSMTAVRLPNDRLPTHSFFGPNNEFTLEALINVPFDHQWQSSDYFATDHGGPNNTNRGLQFRITGTGQLEFNFVGVNTSSVTVPIPTVGSHAFAANEWFHVALVYDGTHASCSIGPAWIVARRLPIASAIRWRKAWT
jgi:hypothetical protein